MSYKGLSSLSCCFMKLFLGLMGSYRLFRSHYIGINLPRKKQDEVYCLVSLILDLMKQGIGGYMVEKTYHIAPYLGAFVAHLMR